MAMEKALIYKREAGEKKKRHESFCHQKDTKPLNCPYHGSAA
jgi:hypothetical protein